MAEGSDEKSASVEVDSFLREVARVPHHQALATPAEPELVGRTLLHFHVVERLGSGGMGVVYKAIDEKLRRAVALKVPSARLVADERHRETLLHEARSAAAVNHPNIASIHEVHDGPEGTFFVMELVEGETLRARVARAGALATPEALRVALGIARGLARAHALRVVHRDLKCDNVMLTKDGDVKLLDFGLATVQGVDVPDVGGANAIPDDAAALAPTMRATCTPTPGGLVAGTPASMAPEQANGEVVDARADVYAFGVVLYEMLSGEAPFAHRRRRPWEWGDEASEAWKPLRPLRALAPRVPADVQHLVERCLAYAKDDRPADGVALVLAVEACTAKLARGRPRPLMTAAVALAIVAATVGGVAWNRRGAPPASSTAAPGSDARPASKDDEVSRSSNPEAQRLYEEGVRTFHEGKTNAAEALLKRATVADPQFGGAYVRYWLLNFRNGGDVRGLAEFQRGLVPLEGTLTARERALATAWEEDNLGDARAIERYWARYPDDCLAYFEHLTPAVMDRALAADPTCAPVLAAKAMTLPDDEAMKVLDRCIEASPHAAVCLKARAVILASGGACDEAEHDVRRWMDVEPDVPTARFSLAALLAARGAPTEALKEVLRGEAPAYGDSWGMLPQSILPMYEGDFREVERLAKAAAERMRDSVYEVDHFTPDATLVSTYAEEGDSARAGRLAVDYLARRRGWKHLWPTTEAFMLGAAERSGLIEPAEADGHLEDDLQQVLKWTHPTLNCWTIIYTSNYSRTPAQSLLGLERLESLDAGVPSLRVPAYGRTLFEAGREDEARPWLEQNVKDCRKVMLFTWSWARAHLYLGELDERHDDTASACAHYAKVLERWGHAKPRSVTADEARAHATKLGCAR